MEWILSEHAKTVVEERAIELEWIARTLTAPDATAQDMFDPALRHALRPIPEAGNRFLRVVYNASVSPAIVVTVFFDRRERRRRESHLQ